MACSFGMVSSVVDACSTPNAPAPGRDRADPVASAGRPVKWQRAARTIRTRSRSLSNSDLSVGSWRLAGIAATTREVGVVGVRFVSMIAMVLVRSSNLSGSLSPPEKKKPLSWLARCSPGKNSEGTGPLCPNRIVRAVMRGRPRRIPPFTPFAQRPRSDPGIAVGLSAKPGLPAFAGCGHGSATRIRDAPITNLRSAPKGSPADRTGSAVFSRPAPELARFQCNVSSFGHPSG